MLNLKLLLILAGAVIAILLGAVVLVGSPSDPTDLLAGGVIADAVAIALAAIL